MEALSIAGNGAPIGVLVVDESEAFLASTLHWIESRPDLRLSGVARNGPEALEAVERLHPQLVIVECVMHGLDGFDLARQLKQRADAPLVLLVTFHASSVARDEAYAAGADGFLAKYDLNDGFEKLLGEWLNGQDGRGTKLRTPATPARPGSRTAPDP
jgi:CheY-like chemotaxis protein